MSTMPANAESRRAPALLLAHTPFDLETVALIASLLRTPAPPEPSCRICGGAPLLWPSAPCSKECLDNMLSVNDDTPFAFFPRHTLPDRRLARPAATRLLPEAHPPRQAAGPAGGE